MKTAKAARGGKVAEASKHGRRAAGFSDSASSGPAARDPHDQGEADLFADDEEDDDWYTH